ncbi:MAG: hypothetical protein EXS02_05650 [Planctomycetes bacterium]|nr:hypothetical protein [Planctomycetota bacterium]
MKFSSIILFLFAVVTSPLICQGNASPTILFRGGLDITPATAAVEEICKLSGTNIVVEFADPLVSSSFRTRQFLFNIRVVTGTGAQNATRLKIQSGVLIPSNQLTVANFKGTAAARWKLTGAAGEAFVLGMSIDGPSSIYSLVGAGQYVNVMGLGSVVVGFGVLSSQGRATVDVVAGANVPIGAQIRGQALMTPRVGPSYTTNVGVASKR